MTLRIEPMVRYPDPAVQVLDPAYARLRVNNAAVERLATGFRWAEGPVWFGDLRALLWSDIPNNRIMRWDEETGDVTVFRKPSNNANGNTRDRQGRLVTCEHDSRRVTRTEYDGRITVVCDGYDGKHLNSPNDLVVKSDSSVWFTDPPFGVLGFYEGHKAPLELPTNVYRVDGRSGQASVVTGEINRRRQRPQPEIHPRPRAARAVRHAAVRRIDHRLMIFVRRAEPRGEREGSREIKIAAAPDGGTGAGGWAVERFDARADQRAPCWILH